MIQPFEMQETHPIKLHDGGVSTTTEVWKMLSASFDGDVDRVGALADSNPRLLTCQYDYTSPLHLAVREGHVELVRFLIERGALDPTYRTHPFLDSLPTVAGDRGFDEITQMLRQALADPSLTREWGDTGAINYEKDETQTRFQQLVNDRQQAEVEAMLQSGRSLRSMKPRSGAKEYFTCPPKTAIITCLKYSWTTAHVVLKSPSGARVTISKTISPRGFSSNAA